MKSKAPFVLALIGLIVGGLFSLFGIFHYFIFKSLSQQEFFKELFDVFSAMGINFEVMLLWSLISSIIGLIISLALIFFVVKIAKNPNKRDFIIMTVLGGLGIFLGMGLGGILVGIGGIIGIVKSSKSDIDS